MFRMIMMPKRVLVHLILKAPFFLWTKNRLRFQSMWKVSFNSQGFIGLA